MSNGEPLLDVGRLRLLREVGLRGSIAGAARSLGLTPSAVSQQLAVLEREAAVALVDRSPRGVALTGAGHALVGRAAEVLEVLASARADLDRIGGALAGPVALAGVASAAATFVSTSVSALRQDHPGIAVRVIAAEPHEALDLLVAGDVELAVVDEYDYVPLALPDFVTAEQLCAEPLVVVRPAGPPGSTAQFSGSSLSRLAAAPWVMPPDTAACGQAVRSACRAAGFEPDVRWETDDMLLLVRAVAAGHGVSVLPRLSVARDAAGVTVAPLREPRMTRRLMVAGRSTAFARPVVAAVVEQLHRSAASAVRSR